jgi:hypothetical protein
LRGGGGSQYLSGESEESYERYCSG